jgi:hypothetical protein
VEQAGRELRSVAHRRFTGVMGLQLGASSMWKRSQSVACDTNSAAGPGDLLHAAGEEAAHVVAVERHEQGNGWNQVFVAASNLVGFDGVTDWCGRSMIVGPRGEVLAAAGGDEPATIEAVLDPAQVAAEREQEPALTNRRPELYPHLALPGKR